MEYKNGRKTQGEIFQIQRFCLHDGDGIRTTVFFKGCPLSCLWCHNPEGRAAGRQLSGLWHKCMNCGRCMQVCMQGVHEVVPQKHKVNFERCTGCGRCTAVCPVQCLETVGELTTAGELSARLLEDRAFWGKQGGVTFSGGEPLFQPEFLYGCAALIKQAGYTVAVETSGYAPAEVMTLMQDMTDHWLYDFKAGTRAKHERLCGKNNEQIRANFQYLYRAGKRLTVRYPMIPGFNDEKEDLAELCRLLGDTSMEIPVEILPFHTLGMQKAERIGQTCAATLPRQDADKGRMEEKRRQLMSMGIRHVSIG